jgi:spermidine/putrescine transport system substrate-binding protein
MLTRRALIQRAGAAALPLWLAGCGSSIDTNRADDDPRDAEPVDRRLAERMVISTWPFYIDIDDRGKRRPTLEAFERRFDVAVRYIEDINSNDEFFAKVRGPLSQGRSVGRDIIMPTEYMAARMHALGWLQPLDRASIPNAKRLQPLLADPSWDPGRRYSLPWQSFITGIGYNRKALGRELRSITDMLTEPKLRNRVTVSSGQEDTLGLIMLDDDRGADEDRDDRHPVQLIG